MSLKTKLVLAITGLVFLVTAVLSLVYMSGLLQAVVQQSYDTNVLGAQQIRYALELALTEGLKDQQVNPNDKVELRRLSAEAVRDNPALKAIVNSVLRYSPTVYDISIGDNDNLALLTTGTGGNDQPLPVRTDYQRLRDSNSIQQLQAVYDKPKVYDVVLPLKRNGEPFATVRVGVRNSLLREQYEPRIRPALTLVGLALLTALVVAFLLGNLALRPMEELSMQLDYWTPVAEEHPTEERETDTVVRVSNKIERIGQRMRNVEEVFSALKENLDQVLGNLQDGILLFTGDGRAVLISDAVNRFLHVDRNELLGLHAREIFDRNTVLGRTVREAWDAGMTLVKEEIVTETGSRTEVSLDFIHDDRTREGLGALLTLHDQESVEVIESELELSRRMSAIGRLTSGVGHEVKNPINAIVVHLELLKNKLGDTGGPATRHLEVIDSEIHRLDRVVQTLVDFSRPVEVKLEEHDLREVVADVVTLAGAEMSTRQVHLISHLPVYPLVAKVDVDLLKQALLNVVQNGAQAMPEGGKLEVMLLEEGKSAAIQVEDQGGGISQELREKIFDLYFTTKKGGSGIGLAMTYRILQLHHGSIEVQSELGRGSVFVTNTALRYGPGTTASSAGGFGKCKGVAGMKILVTRAPWLVSLLAFMPLMQGCDHKAQTAQNQTLAPPIVDAPPPKPATVSTADLPPPVVGNPQPSPPPVDDANNKPAPPPKKPSHPKKTPPATQPTQEASNPAPSVSAIGELSGAASADQRSQAEEMIKAAEKGVNGINRTLSDAETKTTAQIHEFLKQAQEALASGDINGAFTLAKKAKVLLAELNP